MNKKYILIPLLFLASFLNAQITAYINAKPVKSGTTISKEDLTSLQISFKNAKEPSFIYGVAGVSVSLNDLEGESIGYWFYRTNDGNSAAEDFIKNTSSTKKFGAFNGKDLVRSASSNDLDFIFSSAEGIANQKALKANINVWYQEKLGYKKYADPMYLLDNVELNIPIWDDASLNLPYISLTLDNTDLNSEFDLEQNGNINKAETSLRYKITTNSSARFFIATIDNEKHPGLNITEAAKSFIASAAYDANVGYTYRNKFTQGSIKANWQYLTGLKGYKDYFISNLRKKINKSIFKTDLMTFFKPIDVEGVNGFMLKEKISVRNRYGEVEDHSEIVIYILEHPQDPNKVLLVSSNMFDIVREDISITIDQQDAFIKKLLKSFK